VFFFSCSQKENVCQDDLQISQPIETGDGWETANLESVGIDVIKLQEMVDRICDSTYQNIHSVLIIKNGKLVFEQYFKGYTFQYEAEECKGSLKNFDVNSVHNLASVTKSITSILFGIAYDQGYIKDLDNNVFRYFPKYVSLNDSLKNQITLYHLLTMTSGQQWNEQSISIKDRNNDLIHMFRVTDPVEFILSKPVIHKPGIKFYYNGGGTNLLGEVIHFTTGLMLNDFAKKYLFYPLGIDRYKWKFIKPNVVYASGDLKLRPRDMAKIGYLMLNKGMWKKQQILSEGWIEKSTEPYVQFNTNEGYASQWWTKNFVIGDVSVSSFSARGWGGQRIVAFPDLNAVVVFTAGNYDTVDPINEMIYRYVIPSVKENFKYDFDIINNEAPISETFNIVKPSKNLTADIAKLSGHWYGMGDYLIPDQFVVEEIDSTRASILYSWGDHPDGLFKRGWVRRIADVDSSGQIKFPLYDAALTFKLDKNENVLVGYYKNKQINRTPSH
jgi:CubicO group peptidase (beta-lactamase class C family)